MCDDNTELQGCDLQVGYHGGSVINDLNVQITKGTLTALVGPNGSGKSTLLMTLARVLLPGAARSAYTGHPSRHSDRPLWLVRWPYYLRPPSHRLVCGCANW